MLSKRVPHVKHAPRHVEIFGDKMDKNGRYVMDFCAALAVGYVLWYCLS
jgi:hypothetical protein